LESCFDQSEAAAPHQLRLAIKKYDSHRCLYGGVFGYEQIFNTGRHSAVNFVLTIIDHGQCYGLELLVLVKDFQTSLQESSRL
jgi:hypothetical protein